MVEGRAQRAEEGVWDVWVLDEVPLANFKQVSTGEWEDDSGGRVRE